MQQQKPGSTLLVDAMLAHKTCVCFVRNSTKRTEHDQLSQVTTQCPEVTLPAYPKQGSAALSAKAVTRADTSAWMVQVHWVGGTPRLEEGTSAHISVYTCDMYHTWMATLAYEYVKVHKHESTCKHL